MLPPALLALASSCVALLLAGWLLTVKVIEMLRRIANYLYPCLLMALMYVAFSWRLFLGDSAINIYPDNEWFLGPVFSFFSAAIRGLEWPLWMNSVLGGIPLYNSPQVSAYYPFYFVFLNIWKAPLDSIYALHQITLLHIAILEINSYIFLRVLNIARTSAILGVTFIVFNLTTLEVMKWTHLIASYSWLPLYLAGLVRLLDAPKRVSGALMTVVGFTMMVFAMVGQPLVFAGILTAALVTGRVLAYEKISLHSSVRGLAFPALTLMVAILISAIVLLPVVSDLSGMIRWVSPSFAVVGNSPIPFDLFVTDQLSPGEIPFFALPGGARHDIAHPYVGLLPILFALSAIFHWRRRWIIVPLALVALYSFLSAFGDNFGLAFFNYWIPVVNKIREPSYFLIPFTISIGALAAFGFDFLFRRSIPMRDGWLACRSSHSFFLLACSLLLVSAGLLFFITKTPIALSLLALFAFVICAYLIPARYSSKAAMSLGVLFLISLALQIQTVTWEAPKISGSDYLRLNVVRLESAISRIGELDPDRQFRVIFGGAVDRQMASMLASYHRVRTLNSYINPLPVAQFNEMYHHSSRADNYNKGLGAKFLLCESCSDNEVLDYRLLERVAGYSIYVAEDVLPHSYITQNLVGRSVSLNEYVQMLRASDIRSLPLILQSDAFPGFFREGQELNCIKQNQRESLNQLVFVVHCDKTAIFVLNEFFTDAWTASVNGVSVRPSKVNGNQMGVRINSGSSVIRFVYEPWSVRFSRYLSLVGILGLLLISWSRRPNASNSMFSSTGVSR